MRLIIVALFASFQLALVGCTVTPPLPASAAGGAAMQEGYQLGAGDKFRMTVFNEPTLTGQEFAVGGDGAASLPLIGPVKVAGLTARAAEDAITGRYAGGFLRNPRVNIEITAFRPIYVLGEVNKPGEYPFATGMTVLKAVALAEGFTYRASTKRVYIKRTSEGAEQVVPLAADTQVMPGDTVRVIERFF